MPQTANLIEARSIDWVPDDERTGKLWHQAPLWFLGNFQYFSIPIGFIGPALGLSLRWSIVGGALGILVGTLFMAFHASQGPTMGLPQMIQSRAQFGYRGVVVPLVATMFTYLAFNVVDVVLLGDGLEAAFGWNATAVGVLATVAAAALAIFGHDWLHRAFRVLLCVSLPLMLVVSVGILLGAAGGDAGSAEAGFTWIAFLAQFSAAAAYNITYAPYVSDYSRYLPSSTPTRKVIAAVFFGASASAIWLIALGAWLSTRLGATDGLAGLQQAGNTVVPYLGDAAALLSALALWATMGMNAYGGALTVLTGIDSVRPLRPRPAHRVVAVVVLAVVWFAISQAITSDAVSAVAIGLTLMLYLLVPWTAANLVDFFVVRRGHYAITDLFRPDGIYGAWQWRGLAAYAIGLLAEVPFMVLPGTFTGPLAAALGEVDVAWIVGLVVTAAVYLLFSRSLDRGAEHAAEESSEARLGHADVQP